MVGRWSLWHGLFERLGWVEPIELKIHPPWQPHRSEGSRFQGFRIPGICSCFEWQSQTKKLLLSGISSGDTFFWPSSMGLTFFGTSTWALNGRPKLAEWFSCDYLRALLKKSALDGKPCHRLVSFFYDFLWKWSVPSGLWLDFNRFHHQQPFLACHVGTSGCGDPKHCFPGASLAPFAGSLETPTHQSMEPEISRGCPANYSQG